VDEFRRIVGQLYPDASVRWIAVASRPWHRGVPTLTDEEIDDVVDAAATPEELLWRLQRAARPRQPLLELGPLALYPEAAQVWVEGQPVALRRREFELLRFLACYPNRVFRREELLREVWGTGFRGSSRTVDVYIRRLRERLGAFGQRHLQTVRGVGYRMAGESAPVVTDPVTLRAPAPCTLPLSPRPRAGRMPAGPGR
jgi:DNA-binding winged helix-turn-helix (wHTH) protein